MRKGVPPSDSNEGGEAIKKRSNTDKSAPAETRPKPPAARRKALKVLVVEDSTVNQTVIVAMLHRAGHVADVARDGLEAVDAVRDNGYDLVLMDIQMPTMDGVSATREIRRLPGGKANVPIIAVTADVVTGSRERFLAAGMNDYVPKPIRLADLYAAIDRCVGIPC